MQEFSRSELRRLLEREGGPHISLFLPPSSGVAEGDEDRIRLRNSIREIQEKLISDWMTKAEAIDFLSSLNAWSESAEVESCRMQSVACYLAQDFFETYAVDSRLDQCLVLQPVFHVRPLLPVLQGPQAFHVLTLSKKRVELLAGTSQRIEAVDVPNLPGSFEVERASVTAEPGMQVHSAAAAVHGKEGAVFHGQGGMPDSEKTELRQYFARVDEAVVDYLREHGAAPVVLAGVEYETAMYRQLSRCRSLLAPDLAGNPDHLSRQQLLERSLPLVEEESCRRREIDAKRIAEHVCPTATDAEQILVAAYEGRIDTLFCDQAANLYGSFDPQGRVLKELHHPPTGRPDDPSHDLIEVAIAQTFKHAGGVYVVSADCMPCPTKMAAALRY